MIICTFSKELESGLRDPSTPELSLGRSTVRQAGAQCSSPVCCLTHHLPPASVAQGPFGSCTCQKLPQPLIIFLMHEKKCKKENFLLFLRPLWLEETVRDTFSEALNCFVPLGTKNPKTLKLFTYNKNRKAPAFRHQNNPVLVQVKTETAALDTENSRSFVCILPITQEVFEKNSFSWRSGQGVELESFSVLLEADIVDYCCWDILAQ